MPRKIPVRPAAAVVLALLGLPMLAACGSTVARPEVVWTEGKPDGPLEDDPWVEAVRASDLELEIAITTRDFTAQALYETTDQTVIDDTLDNLEVAADLGEWWSSPGPRPMIPIQVHEAPGGTSAAVFVCRANGWPVDAGSPVPDDLHGGLYKVRVTIEDGHYLVDDAEEVTITDAFDWLGADVVAPVLEGVGSPEKLEDIDTTEWYNEYSYNCTLDGAAVGLFNPPPDPQAEYDRDDIRSRAVLPDQ